MLPWDALDGVFTPQRDCYSPPNYLRLYSTIRDPRYMLGPESEGLENIRPGWNGLVVTPGSKIRSQKIRQAMLWLELSHTSGPGRT
jgi:hypothetical protein